MQIINMERGNGKTTMLIYTAFMTGATLVCRDTITEERIINRAKELGLSISTITYHDLKMLKIKDRKLLIDDIDYYLNNLIEVHFGFNEILSCTMSVPCIDRVSNIKKESENTNND